MSKPKAKTAAATINMPERVTPEQKKGSSTCEHPVAQAWVTCLNATSANGGEPPKRSELHKACIAAGVAYYTTRTQVQKYLKWQANGAPAGDLPRGVVVDQ